MPHVRLGQSADLVVVAPATADLLARAAHGLADDLLTNVLLTARCPVVMAPAMHTEMWDHPATQANVATLSRARRARRPARVRPAHRRRHRPRPAARARGPLCRVRARSSRTPAARRVPPAARPVDSAADAATLAGRRVVVTAGGTREPLDPVRFLGNRSLRQAGVRAGHGRRPPRAPR